MVIRTMLVAVLVTGSGKGEIMLSMARCAMLMVMVEASRHCPSPTMKLKPFNPHLLRAII